MIGAIIGDTIGSVYEFDNISTKKFPLYVDKSIYTDDSLMTIAVGVALDDKNNGLNFKDSLIKWMRLIGRAYPNPRGGYGGGFYNWLFYTDGSKPYGSFGNGSAMRCSACGECANSAEEAMDLAARSAEITHNHKEGLKGAMATASAVYLAKTGHSKEEIKKFVVDKFEYDLNRTCKQIRKYYSGTHDITCQGTVPEAIIAFLESNDYEDAVRNAVSLGGDCDTLTDICSAIAWAYYYSHGGITERMKEIAEESYKRLPKNMADYVRGWESEHYE